MSTHEKEFRLYKISTEVTKQTNNDYYKDYNNKLGRGRRILFTECTNCNIQNSQFTKKIKRQTKAQERIIHTLEEDSRTAPEEVQHLLHTKIR